MVNAPSFAKWFVCDVCHICLRMGKNSNIVFLVYLHWVFKMGLPLTIPPWFVAIKQFQYLKLWILDIKTIRSDRFFLWPILQEPWGVLSLPAEGSSYIYTSEVLWQFFWGLLLNRRKSCVWPWTAKLQSEFVLLLTLKLGWEYFSQDFPSFNLVNKHGVVSCQAIIIFSSLTLISF